MSQPPFNAPFQRLLLVALSLLCLQPELLAAPPVRAGEADLPPGRTFFRSYGPEQGLENQSITSLAQDTQGFLWVGTQGNLYRYDGHRFQSFGLEHGLPSAQISALLQLPSGSLLVGTQRGLARRAGRAFEPVELRPGLPRPRVNAMAWSQGLLWVASSQGVFVGPEAGPFRLCPGWKAGEATALCTAPGGEVLALAGQRVHRLDAGRGAQPLPLPPGLDGEELRDMAADAQGTLYLRGTRRLWALRRPPPHVQDLSSQLTLAGTPSLARMSVDGAGRLWVPTEHGLACLEGGVWQRLGPREGLPTPTPSRVLVDRDGSLWVGGRGLYRDLGRGVWRAYTPGEGLPDDLVWCIFRDRSGTLWVGTGRGAARLGPQGWKALEGTEDLAVRRMAQLQDGRLCLGGGSTLLLWDPRSGALLRLDPGTFRGLSILHLLVDRKGILWICTDQGGLFRATADRGKLRVEREPLPQGGPQERVGHLIEDSQGRLWAAAEQGLACLEEGRWRRVPQPRGLHPGQVGYLLQRAQGDFLGAYQEPLGLFAFQAVSQDIRLEPLPAALAFLTSTKVYLMGEDARHRLWVGTGRGVALVEDGRAQVYGRPEGLAGDDCDAMAFLAEPDGRVWIGTSGGLACYLGGPGGKPAPPPSCAILQARLGGMDLDPLTAAIPEASHRDRALEVAFASPDYRNEARHEFRYRLQGRDADWRITRAGEAQYSNLGPGTYCFEVCARVQGGEWGTPAQLRFGIHPAWWQRRLVQAALGLFLLGGAAWLLRQQIRKLKQRNIELEVLLKLADALTRELESANVTLQEQSLTDPLTGLKNRRYLSATIARDISQVKRMHRLRESEEGAPANADIIFLMVDLDHFKAVNDQFGHAAGDAVLRQLADILRAATRGSDTVIRWGGEEFLVVARQSSRDDAVVLAERIRRAVAEHPFDIEEAQPIRCSCSIGFAPFPLDGAGSLDVNWAKVVDLADRCMYRAKEGGRDAWVGLLPPEGGLQEVAGGVPTDLAGLLESGIVRLVEFRAEAQTKPGPRQGAQVDR